MKKKQNYSLNTVIFCFLVTQLIACSGGGSSKAPIFIPQEATQQETDQRIPFEAFTNEMVAEQERKAYEKASKEKIAIHVAIL